MPEGISGMVEQKLINNTVDYSIIIPVYCNEGSLKDLHQTLQTEVILQNSARSYELIFIDDGSYDRSFEILLELKKQDPEHIKLIKFTRNFGQVAAMFAGYQLAKGDCIVNISADLQDPPRLINEMLNAYFDEQYDIVICYRRSRDESFFRIFTSGLFYRTMKKLSFPDMPPGGFDYFLMSRRVRNQILMNNESNPFIQGKILWTGFHKKWIPYDRESRKSGTSKWTFSKKIKYLIDGVLGYSYMPLRAMSLVGLCVSILGFVYAVIILFSKIFGGIPTTGWAPLMIMILILSGIQMLMLGIIGEYLWRALDQSRNRPQFIIDKVYD
jgi:dolichol-phosphate mannosyltransferase